MRVAWLDPLVDYPIYGDLTGSPLFNNSYDISLPLAYVYLSSFVRASRPHFEFVYHPRRLYSALGTLPPIEALISDADVVLTSCSTADSPDARRILRAAKHAGKPTVIGGIYARFSPSEILSWGCADFVVTGEGEAALLAILDHIASGATSAPRIAGVVCPSLNEVTPPRQVPLESLPQPVYDYLPLDDFRRFMRTAYILATRGCPAPCHFCTSARLYGYSYRTRPVHSVVKELADLHSRGFDSITLADDTITVDRAWALDLLRRIADANPGYRLKVRARADELDSEVITAMSAAGVEVVQFGVESINLSTREFMHKRLSQQAIEQAFDLVSKVDGMKANPLYMLAYPGETWDDLERNADFIASVGTDPRVITYVSFTTPYPGTAFRRYAESGRGFILTDDPRYYTNKFPVFLPASLLTIPAREGMARLLAIYDRIAAAVNRSHATQFPVPDEFFADLRWPSDQILAPS